MIMTRQRTMEETAQRREAQRTERHIRRTGRPPVRDAVADKQHLVPRFTTKPGSKRRFAHRPSPAADIARSKAHTWSVVTGRPLPPAARIRTDSISNAVPMPDAARLDHYQLWNRADHVTTAQRSRRRHKLGRQLASLKVGTPEHQQLADAYLALRPDGSAA
jgi:hypothetical protein